MRLNKRGFTLTELLVVIAMIAILTGAMTSSVTGAMKRSRIQRAANDVKIISQAILAYENFGQHELPTVGGFGGGGADADSSSLGFLLGGESVAGENGQASQKVPALLMAALQSGDKMRDPWSTPYKIHIQKGSGNVKFTTAAGTLQTGYFLPNFYRLGKDERITWEESK